MLDSYKFVFMKIEKHIAQLLYRYQCVTIPGFGAFITNIVSAEVNVFTNTFSPPRKNISFNFNLQSNDGLLVNHIAQSEELSYENANHLVHREVEKWKLQLQADKQLILQDIGTINRNTSDLLSFVPFEHSNYLPTSFGLNSYVSPIIKREIESLIEFKTEVKVIAETSESAAQVIPITRPSYWSYAAAAVVFLSVFSFVGHNFYKQQIEAQNRLTQIEVQKEVYQKIQEATFALPNPFENNQVQVSEEDKCFHIVAGSFRSKRNVSNLMDRMVKIGFNPKVVAKDSIGVTQVLYGSYATFSGAQSQLDIIQAKENPEAWIMIKKL